MPHPPVPEIPHAHPPGCRRLARVRTTFQQRSVRVTALLCVLTQGSLQRQPPPPQSSTPGASSRRRARRRTATPTTSCATCAGRRTPRSPSSLRDGASSRRRIARNAPRARRSSSTSRWDFHRCAHVPLLTRHNLQRLEATRDAQLVEIDRLKAALAAAEGSNAGVEGKDAADGTDESVRISFIFFVLRCQL